MFDAKTQNLLKYISAQIESVNSFDETAGKKGTEAKLATAHKKGYIEGLQNVEKAIKENMNYGG